MCFVFGYSENVRKHLAKYSRELWFNFEKSEFNHARRKHKTVHVELFTCRRNDENEMKIAQSQRQHWAYLSEKTFRARTLWVLFWGAQS